MSSTTMTETTSCRSSPLRTVHATFTAHGSAPVGRFVSGHCSPTSHRCILRGWHSGTWVTGRANRLWAFPLYAAFPRSEYYAHTATPSGLGVSLQVSPQLPFARLPIPLGASHVHDPGLLRRPVGGGYPTIPSALCGSPTRSWIDRLSESGLFPFTGAEGVRLLLRFIGYRMHWLSS